MAKRKKLKKCPVCKIEVKSDRLAAHLRNAHPGEAPPAPGERRAGRRATPPVVWAALAVVLVVVVASAGIYIVNKRTAEEPEGVTENPPATGEIYPTDQARIETSRGIIVVELYGNETPKTVENFKKYINDNFYEQTIFHRVKSGFMIQGGGLTRDLDQKPPRFPPIELEIHPKLKNERGTLAMARLNEPDSATSQFFINLVDNSVNLGPGGYSPDGYAVFGRVIQGMTAVDMIGNEPTSTQYTPTGQQMSDVPVQTIIINRVSMESAPGG